MDSAHSARIPHSRSSAILALALGIGANTAMFSVAYGVLLRPLPYPDAGRLTAVFMRYFPRDFAFGTLCIRDYLTWKENNHVFEEPTLFRNMRMDIGGREAAPEQVQGATVTAGFFTTLDVRPLIGRTFAPGEDQPTAAPLAVLGENIWRRRFAASPGVLGRTMLVNGTPYTVIGVMSGDVRLPNRLTEVWTNLRLIPPTRYGPWFYRGVARLKPGVTLDQAQAEMSGIARLMMQQNPYYKRLTLPVLNLRDALLGATLKPAILVLAGAVCMVLLIAVVNVANLMLARATVREREMALRLSLGAGRGRIVRQLLTESALLAVLGGTAGLALAWGAIQLIRAWNPGNLPLIDSVRLDGAALAFMFFVSLLTGVLFGLAPALESVRADLNATIKEGGRAGTASRATQADPRCTRRLRNRRLADAPGRRRTPAPQLCQPPERHRRVHRSAAPYPHHCDLARQPEVQRPGGWPRLLRRSHPPRAQPSPEWKCRGQRCSPARPSGRCRHFLHRRPNLAPGEINPIVSDVTIGPEFFRALGIPLLKGRTLRRTTTRTPLRWPS